MTSPSGDQKNSLTGTKLAEGKYTVGDIIGRGAMGDVYAAMHTTLQRRVAVKVLNPMMMQQPDAAERFRREALAASRIHHPHSMAILDFGQEGDVFYIVMEFLEGASLGSMIRRQGPFAEPRVVTLMSQALSALARAHDEGIIHRDLKPDNIVITRTISDDGAEIESAKVCDFGIAKINDPGGGFETLTNSGDVSGTPQYMSPEQGRGQRLDIRSDLYSCGVILFRMLTGRTPFSGENALAIIYKHVSEPPPPLRSLDPNISKAMESVVLRAMAKDPDDRYQTARDLRRALRETVGWKSETLAGTPPTSPAGTAKRSIRSTTSAPTMPPGYGRDAAKAVSVVDHGSGTNNEAAAGGSSRTAATVVSRPLKRPVIGEAPTEGVSDIAKIGAIAAAVVVLGVGAWFAFGSSGTTPASSASAAKHASAVAADSSATAGHVAPPAQPAKDEAGQAADADEPGGAGGDTVAAPDAEPAAAPDSGQQALSGSAQPDAADEKTAGQKRPKRERRAKRRSRLERPDESKIAEKVKVPDRVAAPPPPPPPAAVTRPPPPPPPPPPAPIAVAPARPIRYDADATLTGLKYNGSLSRKAIDRALRGLSSDAKDCYAKHAKAAQWNKPQTNVTVKFDIDEDGGARNVRTSGGPAGLAKCVAGHVKMLRSRERPDTGTVEVKLTVRFAL